MGRTNTHLIIPDHIYNDMVANIKNNEAITTGLPRRIIPGRDWTPDGSLAYRLRWTWRLPIPVRYYTFEDYDRGGNLLLRTTTLVNETIQYAPTYTYFGPSSMVGAYRQKNPTAYQRGDIQYAIQEDLDTA